MHNPCQRYTTVRAQDALQASCLCLTPANGSCAVLLLRNLGMQLRDCRLKYHMTSHYSLLADARIQSDVR